VINIDSFLNQRLGGIFLINNSNVAILSISWRFAWMVDHGKIQFDLVKLLNDERILRLTDPQTGITLEKKLKPSEAVVRQRDRLLQVFDAALARAELIGA
jgi:hypothetical protein